MAIQFSTKRRMMCMSTLCLVSFGSPAYAEPTGGLWMLLGDGDKLEAGTTPSRVMHFAYPADIRDRTDQNAKIAEITRDANPKTIDARLKALEIAEMDVIEVFENPQAPGFKMLTMQFQCTKKMYRIAKSEWKERNSLHRFGGGTDWQQYVPTDWQSRAYFVACFPEAWRPIAQAEMQEMGRTKTATKQQGLRDYGVGIIGAWGKNDGINQVYRLTWDKIWAGSAKPIPFHHNRNASEEAEYQAWKSGNDAIIAQNKEAAPAVLTTINNLEEQVAGQMKGMDNEKLFQDEIAKNFKKHKSKYYSTFKGITEEDLVDVRGAPTSSSNSGNMRMLVYSYTQDTRQEVVITDGNGSPVGTDVIGQVLNCDVTFKLRVGGNKSEFRVVDYQVNRDMNPQGYGKCD